MPATCTASPDQPRDDQALEALVRTKLVPPRLGGRMVVREPLLTHMLEARRRRCVVLQGPAGWGKTTTLVAWRQALLPLAFQVAWLTLTPEDDELTRFLDYLLAALAQVDPDISREAAELAGRGVDDEAVERMVITLVRRIARHPRELVLVLDDLQHLRDARIHAALQWLLDYAPANLHLAVASRSTVPLSLARLRDKGAVLELDMRELRFSPEESERFLQAQLGAIDKRDAQLLHELSDGWIAGLQLFAVDWKKRRLQTGGAATTPGGFDRGQVQDPQAFAAYFEREVLSRLSPRELELLVSISACSRFCAVLCAAMVGRPDGAAEVAGLLARLEADNLFIIRIQGDDREPWFRLHPLLRETLRGRFARRSEARRRSTHHAAWQWFRDHGLIDEAVRQAVPAGEAAAAAALLERAAPGLAVRGELNKLISLVRQLPPDAVQARVGLRMWLIRVELFARELDAFSTSLDCLRADIPADDAEHLFTLTMLEATLSVQRDDSQAAQALLPRMMSPPAGTDAMALGGRDNIRSWLLLHQGDFEGARQIQAESSQRVVDGVALLGTPSGTLQGRCLVGLSYAREGRMTEAERVYRDVLHVAAQSGSACVDPIYLATALLGEVLYEHDDVDAAIALLEDRVDVLERVTIPDSVLRVHRTLAMAHWAAGRRLESFVWLERLEDYATGLKLDRLLAFSLTMQVHLQLQSGDLHAAELAMQRVAAIEARHPQVDASALGEIATIAERARIRLLMAHGDLATAGLRIEALIARIESVGRQRLIAPLQLLRAVVDLGQGLRASAREWALAGLRRGHRLGLVRSLLDSDPAAVALVREIGLDRMIDPVLAFYIERLCRKLPSADVAPAPNPTRAPERPTGGRTEPLSEREHDVMRLLAHTMSNKKIALTLGLSRDTVKWHLKNIYIKLGVAGRDEAVARMNA